MPPLSRKLLVAAALALMLGLAGYAGTRLSNAHARPRSGVEYLGTITVTPKDTPQHAAQAIREERYATRERGAARPDDEEQGRI